jgi:hypothetical protein
MGRAASLILVTGLIAGTVACGAAADDGPMSSPESTFRTMKAYVADGEYEKVWGLLSSEARQKWARGMAQQKEILRNAGVNRGETERQIREQYGLSGPDFLAASPEELLARVHARTADQMAKISVKEPARIEGDKAFLSLTKDLGPGREFPHAIVMPFVRRGGRWLIAETPNGG